MKVWISVAMASVASFVGVSAADAASCATRKSRDCFDAPAMVNFSAVPDISRQIVSAEPDAAKPKKSVVEAPPITTYTGPTVGVDSMIHAPTVGYYWSLEPEAAKQ